MPSKKRKGCWSAEPGSHSHTESTGSDTPNTACPRCTDRPDLIGADFTQIPGFVDNKQHCRNCGWRPCPNPKCEHPHARRFMSDTCPNAPCGAQACPDENCDGFILVGRMLLQQVAPVCSNFSKKGNGCQARACMQCCGLIPPEHVPKDVERTVEDFPEWGDEDFPAYCCCGTYCDDVIAKGARFREDEKYGGPTP